MKISDVDKISENIAKSIVMFFLKKTYGQDAKIRLRSWTNNAENCVIIVTKYTYYFMLAFNKNVHDTDKFAYKEILIKDDQKHCLYKSLLKLFCEYASKNWCIGHLSSKPCMFDNNSTIEEAMIFIDLEIDG